jgi:hypothetical protein
LIRALPPLHSTWRWQPLPGLDTPRNWKPSEPVSRPIDHAPGAWHDLRLLPASRRIGTQFNARGPICARRSNGQSRHGGLRSGCRVA